MELLGAPTLGLGYLSRGFRTDRRWDCLIWGVGHYIRDRCPINVGEKMTD